MATLLLKCFRPDEISWGVALVNIGLYLDALGAIGLAKSFITKTIEDVTEESTPGWNGSATLSYSLIAQKTDAIIGGLFLVIGFSLQIIGNLHYNPEPVRIRWPCLMVIVVGIGLIYWFLLFKIGHRVANYVFIVMRLKGPRLDGFLNNLQVEKLIKSQVYRVLSRQCNAGKKDNQSFEEYKAWLRRWIETGRRSTLGWWPLRSRPVAWCIRGIFGAGIDSSPQSDDRDAP